MKNFDPLRTDLRIATRASPLAIKQCEIVKNLLPEVNAKTVTITTKGDQILDQSLEKIGGKGLFIKNLERALLQNKADIAVHSMKDMEWNMAKGTKIGAVIKRGSRRDLLIGQWKRFKDLPIHAIVGTSSVRRKAFLLNARPDLKITLLRGNINSRIKQLQSGKFDAIVLAEAGIQRLNIETEFIVLSEDLLLPSAAQGAIAIQYKTDNLKIKSLLSNINDPITEAETLAERSFVSSLNGSCSSPISASAKVIDNKIHLIGAVANPNGTEVFKEEISGCYKESFKIGQMLGEKILLRTNVYELLKS